MADFVAVATVDQLAPGQGMTVTVCGVPVALFNVDGTVYAIDDTCRHAGVSLGTGELRGHVVRCRTHGWRYDVATGHTMHDPAERVTCYPVQVVDGTVLVDVTLGTTAAPRVGQTPYRGNCQEGCPRPEPCHHPAIRVSRIARIRQPPLTPNQFCNRTTHMNSN